MAATDLWSAERSSPVPLSVRSSIRTGKTGSLVLASPINSRPNGWFAAAGECITRSPAPVSTGVAPYGTQGFNQYTGLIPTYQNEGNTPYLRLSNPYPNGLILPPGNSLGLLNDVGFGAVGPIRTEKTTPSEESWSLGIERQLPSNVLLDVEYIGKKGTNLYFGGDNQLNILPASVENYSQDQIAAIQNYVNNPFQGYITNPTAPCPAPRYSNINCNFPILNLLL